MPRYALLIAPSSNRVYADTAPRLAAAELTVFSAAMGGLFRQEESSAGETFHGIDEVLLGGVRYLTFDSHELIDDDLARLSNLSAAFALFRREEDDLLRPVTLRNIDQYDDDLITIQKYTGKTNEQFTKLLLNVTALASGRDLLTDRPVVFDPLAGRGTTLNQALMYGWDALGVEVDGKDFDAYAGFLKTWLRRKRLKHSAEVTPVRRDRKLIARRLEVALGDGRRRGDHSERRQSLIMYSIDTTKAREVIKPRSADLVVTDAPYGVAHGSHHRGLSRKPLDLLREAVPGWVEILRPGGALGMAYNTHTADRDELVTVLESAGLTVVGIPSFVHRVDSAITRDILVARKGPRG